MSAFDPERTFAPVIAAIGPDQPAPLDMETAPLQGRTATPFRFDRLVSVYSR